MTELETETFFDLACFGIKARCATKSGVPESVPLLFKGQRRLVSLSIIVTESTNGLLQSVTFGHLMK